MGMFHIVEEAAVILSRKGVYKQTKVYERDGSLYALHGGGFIRLLASGTSVPDILWADLTAPPKMEIKPGRMGVPTFVVEASTATKKK